MLTTEVCNEGGGWEAAEQFVSLINRAPAARAECATPFMRERAELFR